MFLLRVTWNIIISEKYGFENHWYVGRLLWTSTKNYFYLTNIFESFYTKHQICNYSLYYIHLQHEITHYNLLSIDAGRKFDKCQNSCESLLIVVFQSSLNTIW